MPKIKIVGKLPKADPGYQVPGFKPFDINAANKKTFGYNPQDPFNVYKPKGLPEGNVSDSVYDITGQPKYVAKPQTFSPLEDWKSQQEQQSSPSNFWGKAFDTVDTINKGIVVGNMITSAIDNRNKQREFNKYTADKRLTDNSMIKSPTYRGDYDINNGMEADYGFQSKGVMNQMSYPTAEDGMIVPGEDIKMRDLDYGEFDSSTMPVYVNASNPNPPAKGEESGGAYYEPEIDKPSKGKSAGLKDIIAYTESRGDYKALPYKNGKLASSAVGKYQFLWDKHNTWIKTVTGIDSKEAFRNNPEAQEKAFDYWDKTTLSPWANKIKKELGVGIPINEIKAKVHFAGAQGAYDYYKSGRQVKDAFGTTTSSYAANKPNEAVGDLTGLAEQNGFDVTSTTGGKHNVGSKHYQGKAIDVRTSNKSQQEIAQLIAKAERLGYKVLDERQRPAGQAVWTGPHLHLEESEFGGQNNGNTMKIRIVAGPEKMAYGGQSNYGLDLGSKNVYDNMPKSNYESLGNTVSEDEDADPNSFVLEAEDKETILHPDGTHMKITGRTHAQGGEKLTSEQAPEGSFIYSNSKQMAIKDEAILKAFGMTARKGGYTPAEISKKYDTNKFKAVIEDPNSDKLSKDTAERMLGNYEMKLGKLALVQESMKGMPQGVPKIAEAVMNSSQMAYGGYVPMAGVGIEAGPGKDVDPDEAYRKRHPEYNDYRANSFNPFAEVTRHYNRQGYNGAPDDVGGWQNWMLGEAGKDPYFKKQLVNYLHGVPLNNLGRKMYGKNATADKLTDEQLLKQFPDGKWDFRAPRINRPVGPITIPRKPIEWNGTVTPKIPTNFTVPQNVPESGGDINETKPGPTPGEFDETGSKIPYGWSQQDKNNLLNAGLDYASVKKYLPSYADINPVLPKMRPVDWRSRAAARQSMYNNQADTMGVYSGAQGLASNLSFLAGQQGDALTQDIAQADAQNTDIMNRGNMAQAEIMNNANMYNAQNKDKRMQGNAIANQQYDNALSLARRNMVASVNQGMTNASNMYNMNITESPYYYINPLNGVMKFNSPAAQAGFFNSMRKGDSTGAGAGNMAKQFGSVYQQVHSNLSDISDPKERNAAAMYWTKAIMSGSGGKTASYNYPFNPKNNRTVTTGQQMGYAPPAGYDED